MSTVRRQLELDNAVAAELAGSEDAVLRTLEGHLDCDVFLRGNVLTLEGDDDAVDAAAAVVRELSELIAQGHEIAPGTIEAVTRALDAHESPGGDPRGRRLAPPRDQGRAQDRQPEALRRLDPRTTRSPSGSARPAPARPSWRSRWPRPRSAAARSTGSSSPAPRSRPASGSASCPAT